MMMFLTKFPFFEMGIFRDVFNNNRDNLKQLLHVVVVGDVPDVLNFLGIV